MAQLLRITALCAIMLLAVAGAADAKSSKDAQPKGDPPEHAAANGLAKHAEPPVEPPAEPVPIQVAPIAPTPEPQPALSAPATSSSPTSPELSFGANLAASPVVERPAAEPQPDAAPANTPRTPTAPPDSVESRVDTQLAAATLGGAATTRTPGFSGGVGSSPAAGSPDAPWWHALAWAAPVVGIGGVAAVLVARHRRRLEAPVVARPGRMAPVSPDDVKGLLQNGHVAAQRGAYDEAVAWFDRVVRIAPTIGVAHFCRGICLAASGRVAEAYGSLRSACEHEPADASYRIHFARAALVLGKHKEAMDALEIVARAMPELGPAMLEDPQLAGLRDHPRFLMICGAL